MKLLTQVLVGCLLFLVSFSLNGQVQVFTTFENFENNNGVEYDDYVDWTHTIRNKKYKLVFVKEDLETDVSCDEIWGFTYKENIFRINHYSYRPVKVVSNGKIVYYENGLAHLKALKNESQLGAAFNTATEGYPCLISKSLSSYIFPLKEHKFSRLKKKFPDDSEFLNCLNMKNLYYKLVRQCVEEYEGG